MAVRVGLSRLAVKVFGNKEQKDAMNFLKGKKTLLGLLILQVPAVWQAIAPLLNGVGMSHASEVGFKVVGALVAAFGFAMKFATDPDAK